MKALFEQKNTARCAIQQVSWKTLIACSGTSKDHLPLEFLRSPRPSGYRCGFATESLLRKRNSK